MTELADERGAATTTEELQLLEPGARQRHRGGGDGGRWRSCVSLTVLPGDDADPLILAGAIANAFTFTAQGGSVSVTSEIANGRVGGKLSVRDLPGTGCVFTIELPTLPLAS